MGSFTQLNYHIVFGTKYRRPTITDDMREELFKYLGGVIREKDGSLTEVGGVSDHVHLLARLSPRHAIADTIRDIKANSSKWASSRSRDRWEWQLGYGAFTVSYSHLGTVREYVRNQEEHHRQRSFQEEYVALLERHGIEFKLEYLFEREHHG